MLRRHVELEYPFSFVLITEAPSERRSSYSDRLLAKTARTTIAERSELLEFRSRMYGPASVYADRAWVSWLYDQAPGSSDRGPTLWTWRHEGQIQAHQGAISTRLRVGSAEYDLAWAIDLMVSPAHRQRGVGGVLPRLVVDSSEVTAGTEVSEAAQKAFRRAGWSDLGKLVQWVRVVRGAPLLGRVMAPLPAAVLGGLVSFAARGMSIVDRARTRGLLLEAVDAFDERADTVWERCAPDWPIIARRDRAWLAWRWGAHPRREEVRPFWIMDGAEPAGWVVLKYAPRFDAPSAFILDLLCRSKDLGALLALSVREMSRRPIAAVYCLCSAPGSARTFRNHGFIPRNTGFQFMNFAPRLPETVRALLADSSQWFLTAGDSDLDRPRETTVYA